MCTEYDARRMTLLDMDCLLWAARKQQVLFLRPRVMSVFRSYTEGEVVFWPRTPLLVDDRTFKNTPLLLSSAVFSTTNAPHDWPRLTLTLFFHWAGTRAITKMREFLSCNCRRCCCCCCCYLGLGLKKREREERNDWERKQGV